MRAALILIFAFGLFLAAKLFFWQIIQMDELTTRGQGQLKYKMQVPARRGDIVTTDGALLATDVYVYNVTATPRDVRNRERVVPELARVLKQPAEQILAKLQGPVTTTVTLAQGISQPVAEQVQQLKEYYGVGGLSVEGAWARRYPANAFAAHLIGYVNAQRTAAWGIEQYKDLDLKGVDGEIRGTTNVYRNDAIPFDLPTGKPAVDGDRLTLTIHSGLQRIVETELATAVRDSRGTGGTVIVMHVKTGAVVAMASLPIADLNAYSDLTNQDKYANPAVNAQYEPGSVFKVITLACALDAGTITAAMVYDDNGFINIGGRTIRNHDNLAPGRVTLTDVMRMSLNVEAVKMSVGLGADKFYQCVRRFGFGARTRVELAAEAVGNVKAVGDGQWREVDLGTNSFGQGIAVTPLQMVTAISAVANQGKLMRPQIVAAKHAPNGKTQPVEPELVRAAIRPETAQLVTRILTDAILAESTNKAVVPGYHIAGKTGTAQIPVAGILDPRWTIASFVGYLPAEDPQYTILVKIDKPQTSEWGSQIASPVFAAVAKQLVSMTGVPAENSRVMK